MGTPPSPGTRQFRRRRLATANAACGVGSRGYAPDVNRPDVQGQYTDGGSGDGSFAPLQVRRQGTSSAYNRIVETLDRPVLSV
jgi:hypothetical protein